MEFWNLLKRLKFLGSENHTARATTNNRARDRGNENKGMFMVYGQKSNSKDRTYSENAKILKGAI